MLVAPARKSVTLSEQIQSAPGRVDHTRAIVKGVKILGTHSRNRGGYEYSPAALQQAATFYENIRVNLDHPSRDRPNENRSVKDWVGHLQNCRVTPSGVIGDLCLIKSHPFTPAILEAAETRPNQFGLSHNGDGTIVTRGGKRVVESIEHVRSVDIVCNPATNSSLFESLGSTRTPTRKSVDLSAVRCIVRDPELMGVTKLAVIGTLLRPLLEMDGMADSDPTGTPHESTDLESNVIDVIRDSSLSVEQKLKRISELLNDSKSEASDPAAVPVDSADLKEQLLTGRTRAQNSRVNEGASSLLEALGGKPLAGTQRAAERQAEVAAMIKRYR